ncbi:DNA-3-methyladenine glycosylase [Deinococcus sp.]|uniref:DNA-3-methyladenine glycosylase n=1 Tax=Deinococcus sp. TaxID=47478 RepID=UPI003CC64EDC
MAVKSVPLPYPPAFFNRDPVRVARELLGSRLVRTLDDGRVMSGRVVETEAYDCPRDPSCTAGRFHAARSAELSLPPGTFLFWVAHTHPLLQVACREEGIAASVLLRALEPLEGELSMLEYRPVTARYNLTSGPAKLVQALHVTPDFRGQRVNGPHLALLPGESVPDERVSVTARVGIRAGQNLPWRFLETGNPWLSSGKPSMEL